MPKATTPHCLLVWNLRSTVLAPHSISCVCDCVVMCVVLYCGILYGTLLACASFLWCEKTIVFTNTGLLSSNLILFTLKCHWCAHHIASSNAGTLVVVSCGGMLLVRGGMGVGHDTHDRDEGTRGLANGPSLPGGTPMDQQRSLMSCIMDGR